MIEEKRTDARSTLLEMLARHAYQYSSDRPFLLVSGQYSDEYLDCRLALSQSEGIALTGQVFLERLHMRVVALGGLTMGSDPIAMGTSCVSHRSQHPVRWFTVRKEAKAHGQRRLIEGQVETGECVAIVDDVVTSGSSTIRAIEACRECGLNLVQVLVLVDRQQSDGLANIQSAVGPSVDVSSIFTKEEVKRRWTEIRYQCPRVQYVSEI
jgi:orotate phosphoribosyltransferase